MSGDGTGISLKRRRERSGLRYRRRSATGVAQAKRKIFGRTWGQISHHEAQLRKGRAR